MTNIQSLKSILDMCRLAEKLKTELRHSWVSSGRQESVAEHSWQMALIAMLVHNHLDRPIDLEKTLKMIIIHDLVEAETGDIPYFEKSDRKKRKAEKEIQAITKIRDMMGRETGQEFYDLFLEFEKGNTPEAKFAKALDHLEVQIQHNLADFSTWEEIEYGLVYTKMNEACEYDSFLDSLKQWIISDAEEKMSNNGVNLTQLKQKILSETKKEL